MMKLLKVLKKIMIMFFVLTLLIILFVVGVNIYVKQSVKDKIITVDEAAKLEDVDCILVLGASVKNGDTPSLMLSDRLDKGIELYFAEASPKLLMSGDHGSKYYDEVNVMKNYAINHDVPSSDVFMDHAGFSTYDSIYRAKEVYGIDKMIIVTQEYHLPRALYISKKLGIEAYGVPAKQVKYNGQEKRDIREVLAITKDFFNSIIKPESSLLGGSIDISGDGDITNDK